MPLWIRPVLEGVRGLTLWNAFKYFKYWGFRARHTLALAVFWLLVLLLLSILSQHFTVSCCKVKLEFEDFWVSCCEVLQVAALGEFYSYHILYVGVQYCSYSYYNCLQYLRCFYLGYCLHSEFLYSARTASTRSISAVSTAHTPSTRIISAVSTGNS